MGSEAETDEPKLRRSLFGYSPKDVDRRMEEAAETIDRVMEGNSALLKEVERLRTENDRLKRDDQFVNEAIISAQKSADEIRVAALRQAESIVEEARQTAAEQANVLAAEAEQLQQDIERLRAHRKQFIDDFRLVLEKSRRDLKRIATGDEA